MFFVYPQFILERPSEEMHHSIARSKRSSFDLDQVVVDLQDLSKELIDLADTCLKIDTDMVRLLRSVREL